MTARELRNKLSLFPDDWPVVVYTYAHGDVVFDHVELVRDRYADCYSEPRDAVILEPGRRHQGDK